MTADEFLQHLTNMVSRDGRVPAERELALRLGVSRLQVRRVLGMLEQDGRVSRHVGRGTFLTEPLPSSGESNEPGRPAAPAQVVEARLALEPLLAARAATAGTAEQLDAVAAAFREVADAKIWADYQVADRRFHRAIALAAANSFLLAAHDLVAGAIRQAPWDRRPTDDERPPQGGPDLAEHAAVLDGLRSRQRREAAEATYEHVRRWGRRVLGPDP